MSILQMNNTELIYVCAGLYCAFICAISSKSCLCCFCCGGAQNQDQGTLQVIKTFKRLGRKGACLFMAICCVEGTRFPNEELSVGSESVAW